MSRAFFCLVALISCRRLQPRRRRRHATVPRPFNGTASIRGRVMDSREWTPPVTRRHPRRRQRSGGKAGRWSTDGAGDTRSPGFQPAPTPSLRRSAYVRTAWGEQRPEGPGKRIPLTDGQVAGGDRPEAEAHGGVITGKIVDEFGDPVDRRCDHDALPVHPGIAASDAERPRRETNDIGESRLYGLTPGQYSFRPRCGTSVPDPIPPIASVRPDVLSRHGQRRGGAASNHRAG